MDCKHIELDAQVFCGNARFGLLHHRQQLLRQLVAARHRRPGILAGANTAHHGLELALHIVVNKQLLGQHRLIVEHVNQKTQGTEVVAKLLKSSGRPGQLLVHFGHQHLLHAVAHAQHRLGSLIQAQNRKNAAHLRELTGYGGQGRFFLRIAEKYIQGLLQFTERNTQLAHHAAHGLLVTDPPVKLFHPRLQRLGLAAASGRVQTLGQPGRPAGQLGVARIQVFKGRFEVKHGGCHFQRELDRWRLR